MPKPYNATDWVFIERSLEKARVNSEKVMDSTAGDEISSTRSIADVVGLICVY